MKKQSSIFTRSMKLAEKKPNGFTPSAQAVGCYLEIDGRLLLLQYSSEKSFAGQWDVPGGKLEEGETPEAGAIRELFEETGIALDDPARIQHVLDLYIRGKYDYIYHQFKVTLDGIVPIRLSSEHQNYLWASQQDLKELPLVGRSDEILEMYHVACRKMRNGANVNAYLILRQEDRILFSLRKNTGYCDGMWGLVAGHVEEGESATLALVREAREEIGLHLEVHQLQVVHVMHRQSDRNNIDIFFDCPNWEGSVTNSEPHKCAELGFYSLDALPHPLIDYIAQALHCSAKGQTYSEYGF
jgi:8-oxo-dGTP diphosphatase